MRKGVRVLAERKAVGLPEGERRVRDPRGFVLGLLEKEDAVAEDLELDCLDSGAEAEVEVEAEERDGVGERVGL